MTNYPDFSSHGYQAIRELGRNREAGRITYLATALNQNQQVVIKEFRFAQEDTNWSGFKAYQREIEVLQQLDHPRIPRYLDSFETPQGFCLVQEYKNAPSLAERYSFTAEQIKQIALSVLEILAHLQKRVPPVIHRDIKPENILVDEQQNAYLVDFGFARIQGGKVALSSVAVGTPGFMPPEEQFGRPLNCSSDLYSLGATLICLVTGTRSVDVGKLIDENYRFNFKGLVPQLSPRFVEWLTKMVEPSLKNRYANAAVALEALKPIEVMRDPTNAFDGITKLLFSKPLAISTILGITGITVGNAIVSRLTPPTVQSNAIPLYSSSVDFYKQGEKLRELGYYKQALAAYDEAIKINSNDDYSWYGRCRTLRDLKMEREALRACNRVIKINPKAYWAWVTRGNALNQLVKYEQALASYDKAIQILPNYDYAWSGRCNTLIHLGRFQEALVACEMAVNINPDYEYAWNRRGWALEVLGRYPEAIASYEKALQINPRNRRSASRKLVLEKLANTTNTTPGLINPLPHK